jgi:hypothetical protein
MANLTENDAYDSGVYQWETTDSALGGPLGVMNKPLLSLVNRSRYLLNRLLDGALGFMADTGAKNAIAATLAQPMPGLVDGVKVAFRTKVTNDAAVTLALTNAAGGPTLATLPVYGSDQAALIGGELPAGSVVNVRLNTALNAANGGAWVIESISGGYANIPTAPTGDMTKKAANMAAIFAATDGYQVVDVSGSTDTTLTQAQYGVAMLKLTGVLGASKNLILPAQSGQWIIDNEATGNFNVTAKAAGSSGSTVILPAGSPVIVCSDGTNVKFASAGGQSYMKAYPFSGLATNTLTITGGYTPGAIIVERNGALQEPGTAANPDYTATDGATIVFNTALTSDEYVTVYTFATFSVANAVQKSGDTMGGPLALYAGSTVSTPAALDNSAAVANTAAMNRVGGVVGSVRNGRMVVGAVSSTATYTADEVVLETALGGAPFRASAVNQAINLATTGAGGISGSLTASGFAATYLIYGPVTGLSNITIDATSTVAPEVCPAGNIPSGYTASALVSVWPLNASKQFIVGSLIDRTVNFAQTTGYSGSGAISIVAAPIACVPKNAKFGSGSLSITVTNGGISTFNAFTQTAVGASTAVVSINTPNAGGGGMTINFSRLPFLTQQTWYVATTQGATISNVTLSLVGYEF